MAMSLWINRLPFDQRGQTMWNVVSTWMGDRLGILPRAVDRL